jgi:negative regulator of flagellin synthesis FlgM
MKISLEEVDRILRSQATSPAAPKVANGNGNGNGNGSHAAAPAASVEISQSAQDIARVRQIVEQTPDVREDLVASLRERISKGEYHVSSAEIADLMLRRAVADTIR